MERLAFAEPPSRPFDQKAGPGPPGRRRGGKGSAVLGPLLDAKPLLASHRRRRPGWKCKRERSRTLSSSGRRRVLHDQGRFEMSEFSDSYVLRVCATRTGPSYTTCVGPDRNGARSTRATLGGRAGRVRATGTGSPMLQTFFNDRPSHHESIAAT
jgi:hypothetical protein